MAKQKTTVIKRTRGLLSRKALMVALVVFAAAGAYYIYRTDAASTVLVARMSNYKATTKGSSKIRTVSEKLAPSEGSKSKVRQMQPKGRIVFKTQLNAGEKLLETCFTMRSVKGTAQVSIWGGKTKTVKVSSSKTYSNYCVKPGNIDNPGYHVRHMKGGSVNVYAMTRYLEVPKANEPVAAPLPIAPTPTRPIVSEVPPSIASFTLPPEVLTALHQAEQERTERENPRRPRVTLRTDRATGSLVACAASTARCVVTTPQGDRFTVPEVKADALLEAIRERQRREGMAKINEEDDWVHIEEAGPVSVDPPEDPKEGDSNDQTPTADPNPGEPTTPSPSTNTTDPKSGGSSAPAAPTQPSDPKSGGSSAPAAPTQPSDPKAG